jgi:hypothetical protein
MRNPEQVIEDIRKTRFGAGLDIARLPTEVQKHIEDNKRFKEDAARLVTEIHAKEPHFILELIQNADDNDYDENASPMVKFIVEDDRLTLQNNEMGFREENVWALCGIGRSLTDTEESWYVPPGKGATHVSGGGRPR